MTITVDCRMINASGIGVYLRGCLPSFLLTRNNFNLIGESDKLTSFLHYSNVKVIECNVKPFSVKELLFFPAKILKNINNSNIFYSPFFNIPRGIKIPVYITIHDIIFLDIPEIASKAGVAVRKWFFRRAYNKSKIIFTVSNFSKARIEHHLGACKNIIVTHSAVRPLFLEYRKNNKIIQKEQTIVFLGNIKKHKGLDTLLDAFKLAKEEGLHHKLLIIGSKEKFRTTDNAIIKKLETFEDDSVSFTGFISDDKLMELLSKASLLVQPSVYEGFCLPPLEAMVLGTHALISDIAVLKEIYSNFPVTYFKEGDILDLKENIIKLLYNKPIITLNLSDELRDKYAFEKTASVILENILYK